MATDLGTSGDELTRIKETRELIKNFYNTRLTDDSDKALFRDYLLVFDRFEKMRSAWERTSADNIKCQEKIKNLEYGMRLVDRLLNFAEWRKNGCDCE